MNISVIIATNIVLMLGFIYVAHRITKELYKRDHIIRELQRDLGALCAGASGVSGHLSRVDQEVKRMMERQDKVEIQDPENRAYHQAIRMIRNGGAGVDELMANFGLVRSEAELLVMLHRQGDKDQGVFYSAD